MNLKRLLPAFPLLTLAFSAAGAHDVPEGMPNIADAWIQKFGDMYYMTGTPCPGDWEMQWVGLWKSRDLVNWSGPVMVFEGEVRDRPMWASEIHRKGDDYYIITTCNTWNPGNTFIVEKAPAPEGPYSFHAFLPKRGLDPSIFTDTDGKSYLLDSEWIAPLDEEWTKITADFIGHRANKEGPFMIKSNNEYQRFYARIDDTYFMEMEKRAADSPYSEAYEECGVVLDGAFLPGHGCIVASPDGSELWYASHVTTGGWETRTLGLAPMTFDREGMPVKTTRDLTSGTTPSLNRKVNIAAGKPANSSSAAPGFLPSYATDGDSHSHWRPMQSGSAGDSYLEIDLLGEFYLEKAKAKDTKGKDISCDVMLSSDRVNWRPMAGGGNEARFVRFQDFKSDGMPEVSEVEIYRQPYRISERGGLMATFAPGDAEGVRVPADGTYDIEYIVESRSNDSAWTLYDNGTPIASERVASTGPEGKKTKVISFNVPLKADRMHKFRIVPCGGDFTIDNVSIYSLR